ncbi:hypothetical protein MP228_008368 [Amoeboaphelidium protococcarum]|nr:hypothetical protein MP228_008368 [Amoeboaphelidium protococcarum]
MGRVVANVDSSYGNQNRDQKKMSLSKHHQLKGTGMNSSTYQLDDSKAKVIYFVRHAQAMHNVAPFDFSIPDPRLTEKGVSQSLNSIKQSFSVDELANVQLIVSSPLRRCLQTVQNAFGRMILWSACKFELWADLQETGNVPCDTGSASEDLRGEFPSMEDQINALPLNWYMKQSVDAEVPQLQLRAQKVLQMLFDRPERVITVCTHNGFLRYLVGHDLWTKRGRQLNGFLNGEVRRLVLTRDDISGKDVIVDGAEQVTQFSQSTENLRIGRIESNSIMEEVAQVGYLD